MSFVRLTCMYTNQHMYYSNGDTKCLKPADDTKCLKPVCSISDCLSMQIDLLNLTTWSQHWNLNFNAAKCALLRFSSGCLSTAFDYILISAQETHRDLGIIMSSYLSWREHMKNNQEDSLLPLVHSQLTYCSQIWHPHLLKDIIILENIQHRATKYILNNFTSDYRSHLIALKILPLMMQLELYDVIFFIRSLKGPTNAFNIDYHVTFHTDSTHSSSPQVETCFVKH